MPGTYGQGGRGEARWYSSGTANGRGGVPRRQSTPDPAIREAAGCAATQVTRPTTPGRRRAPRRLGPATGLSRAGRGPPIPTRSRCPCHRVKFFHKVDGPSDRDRRLLHLLLHPGPLPARRPGSARHTDRTERTERTERTSSTVDRPRTDHTRHRRPPAPFVQRGSDHEHTGGRQPHHQRQEMTAETGTAVEVQQTAGALQEARTGPEGVQPAEEAAWSSGRYTPPELVKFSITNNTIIASVVHRLRKVWRPMPIPITPAE